MLVLTRKQGEQIDLRDEHGNVVASLTILRLKNRRASIGINAIPQLKITRKEKQPTTKQAS